MASNLTLTVTGHLADTPEVRTTNTGRLVTNFTVIANDRRYDRHNSEWIDAGKTAIRVTCWEDLAENVGNSLKTGSRVTVTGHRLTADAWIGRGDEARASLELTASGVAVDLGHQRAEVTKTPRTQPLSQ